MTPPPTITAWAIKAPSGKIIPGSVAGSRAHAWNYEGLDDDAYEKGYRCVRVQITEVQE